MNEETPYRSYRCHDSVDFTVQYFIAYCKRQQGIGHEREHITYYSNFDFDFYRLILGFFVTIS